MIRLVGVTTLLCAVALSAASYAAVPGQAFVDKSDSSRVKVAANDQNPKNKNPANTLPSEDEPATPDQMGAPGSPEHDCAAACDARCSSLGSPELTVQCRRNCAGRCLAPVEK